jgi:hypothetical protein
MDLKHVGKDHLLHTLLGHLSDKIGSRLRHLAWIDVLFLFAPSGDAIFVHHPFDAIFSSLDEHSKFAMSQRIIQFMPLLNADG